MTDADRVLVLREALAVAAVELRAADQILKPDGDRWSFAADEADRVLAETAVRS